MRRPLLFAAVPLASGIAILGCLLVLSSTGCHDSPGSDPSGAAAAGTACQFVDSGWGAAGAVPLRVEKAITGLEVPWSVIFLPNGDWLITERPGRVRLVRAGRLVPAPVVTVAVGESGEGGLLGLALAPDFASSRQFVIYYTANEAGAAVNRLERYTLAEDHASAEAAGILLDHLPSGSFHDGGRVRFGPDGKLYLSVGDARTPELAQDMTSLNGKILRLNADGSVPADNPVPGSAVFVSGVRNSEAFDWVSPGLLIVADHGPTGELGLEGRDEVSFASAGSNLGWPRITACDAQAGLANPILAWNVAAPPGGGVLYRGDAIPEFKGNFILGMLGIGAGSAQQLHRVVFDAQAQKLVSHEVYLQGQYGRLRDVSQGPDGALYVTTSNCESRGTCPAEGDVVLRITHG